MTDRVEVYFNLHKRLWSVRDARTGLVTQHARVVSFPFGAEFVVREAGRQKVLQEKRKNVHAFIRGRGAYIGGDVRGWQEQVTFPDSMRVRYNPYEAGYFMFSESREPVRKAEAALMIAPEGFPPQVWAVPTATSEPQRFT